MKRSLLLSTMLLAACTADQGPVGEATATITQLPIGVACIQIQVVGSRTVTRNADVMPGVSSVVSLPNLPAGADTFSAAAFAVGCSAIAGATANWASDPVVATVAAGAVTPVTLAMHGIGGANVGVDFPGDGGTLPTDGGVMPPVDLAGPTDLSSPPSDLTVLPDLSGPPAQLAINPAMASFPPQTAGLYGQFQTLTVVNVGGQPTGMLNKSITGANPMDFIISSDTCNTPLFPMGSCTVSIQFHPTAVGSRNGFLTMQASPGGVVSSSLSGTGL